MKSNSLTEAQRHGEAEAGALSPRLCVPARAIAGLILLAAFALLGMCLLSGCAAAQTDLRNDVQELDYNWRFTAVPPGFEDDHRLIFRPTASPTPSLTGTLTVLSGTATKTK